MNSQESLFGKKFRLEKINGGKFTISSPTGEWRTFRIKRQPDNHHFKPGVQIVTLLSGPDNEDDYQSFGEVTNEGIIKVWYKKRQASDFWEKSARALRSLLTEGQESPYYKLGMRIMESTTCCVCGRTLTTPESVETGIGPICSERMFG